MQDGVVSGAGQADCTGAGTGPADRSTWTRKRPVPPVHERVGGDSLLSKLKR